MPQSGGRSACSACRFRQLSRLALRVASIPGTSRSCFFSSRRRHTIFDCDWSSDVCSSDLTFVPVLSVWLLRHATPVAHAPGSPGAFTRLQGWYTQALGATLRWRGAMLLAYLAVPRSEERRVGEEGRSRWSPDPLKKTDSQV